MDQLNVSAPSPRTTGSSGGEGALPIRNIRDFKLRGKSVFLRLDLNVPLSEPDAEGRRTVTETNRINEALPTIRYALAEGARLVVASHLGRPKGESNPAFSLEPVAAFLAQALGQDVTLADDCVGEGIELMVKNLRPGQILLLENLRFHGQEEANDPDFCRKLAKLADVYINDAFGTAHRKHASTYGLPQLIEERGVGLLIEKELLYLNQMTHQPSRPFFLVLGGAKVADKIKAIQALIRHIDGMIIGGGMAQAFLAATGKPVHPDAIQPTEEGILAAQQILRDAGKRELPVLLPIDDVGGNDIGPKTVELFSKALSGAKTVFWNGPMGWFENPKFSGGTEAIAKAIANLHAVKIVGGGDSVAAANQVGIGAQMDHLSTGGGAVLKFLENGGLPGIDVLRRSRKAETITLN